MAGMLNPRLSARTVLLLGCALFSLGTFCMGAMAELIQSETDSELLQVYLLFAVIFAAPVLLSVGAVFGQGRYWLRILLSFGMGLVLVGFWVGGEVTTASSVDLRDITQWDDFLIVLLSLPMVYFAMQAPLWVVRLLFNWRIVATTRSAEALQAPSSTVGGMLLTMGFIGLALGGVRLAGELAMRDSSSVGPGFWIGIIVAAVLVSLLSLVVVLPVLLGTLRARKPAMGMGGIGIYTALWLAMFFLLSADSYQGMPGLWPTLIVCLVVVSFMTTVTMPLLITRRFGYRLQWGRGDVTEYEPNEAVAACEASPFAAPTESDLKQSPFGPAGDDIAEPSQGEADD